MKQLGLLIVGAMLMYCSQSSPESADKETSVTPAQEKSPVSTDPLENKGIGPITSLKLGPIDQALVEEGQVLYQELCTACHKPNEKFIGPAPAGIMSRRSPEWVMNMILNPDEMLRKDPIAKQLLVEYNMAPMANQGLTEDQARNILEYFRTLE